MKKPQKPKPLDLTPLITVTQEHQLHEMLEDLRQQQAIAVDLEVEVETISPFKHHTRSIVEFSFNNPNFDG